MTRALVLFVALCSVPAVARAHPTPSSFAFVDFTVDGAHLAHDVPVEELERALHTQLLAEGESAEAMVAREGARLGAYARGHLTLTGASGVDWPVELRGLTGHASDDGPRVIFSYVARAPLAEASATVRIRDDLVAHEVVSHYTHVYVRSDFAAGGEKPEPVLAGIIHAGRFEVEVARRGSLAHGLARMVSSGMEHIATGTDHLMFVFSMLLAAPVVAVRGRWRERRTTRQTLRGLALLVSAFTVGHSLTLVLGALDLVTLPSSVVEPAIALSIFCAALHALWPLFPRRELVVVGGFGLIHGLAFASTLPRHDLGSAQLALTLFGFNLGIELAQLALVALVAPWLLLLAQSHAFTGVRVGGAVLTALFAVGWLLERTLGAVNPCAVPLAWLERHAPSLGVALAVAAMAAYLAWPVRRAPCALGRGQE